MKAKAPSSLPVVYKAAEERLLCRKGGTSESPHKSHTSGRDWERWNRQYFHPPTMGNELLKSK